MELDDDRWTDLHGGYRQPYDSRNAIRRLVRGDTTAWEELWQELHHQGDVGEASYAAVPEIVRAHRARGVADRNTYALASTIEEVRHNDGNPALPEWLRQDYDAAWQDLEALALRDFSVATDRETIDSIFAVLALRKGRMTLARMAMLTEDERQEMLDEAEQG